MAVASRPSEHSRGLLETDTSHSDAAVLVGAYRSIDRLDRLDQVGRIYRLAWTDLIVRLVRKSPCSRRLQRPFNRLNRIGRNDPSSVSFVVRCIDRLLA